MALFFGGVLFCSGLHIVAGCGAIGEHMTAPAAEPDIVVVVVVVTVTVTVTVTHKVRIAVIVVVISGATNQWCRIFFICILHWCYIKSSR